MLCACCAESLEPAHGLGVVGLGGGMVDELVEQLVVAGEGDVEALPDGGFLGAGVDPAEAFEVEDVARDVGELAGDRLAGVGRVGGVGVLWRHGGNVRAPADTFEHLFYAGGVERRDVERVIPGTYRPANPVRAVWVTNYGDEYRPGLLLAWRKQFLPSVADQKAYWFGLVLFAGAYDDEFATEMKWCWDPYILPVPNDAVVHEMAREERRNRGVRHMDSQDAASH